MDDKIYIPRPMAKAGANTAKLFEQLPAAVEETLDVTALRIAVAEWDSTQGYAYPTGFTKNSFKEEKIADVPVSLLRNNQTNSTLPTILFIHGGGFFCELAQVHQSLMANIASRIPCHGVLPHYSLAPEVKAPIAIAEVTRVLQEMLSNPKRYGITDNIVVVGYSAGANLAFNAVLNLLKSAATHHLIAKIPQLILMSPWMDVSMKTSENSPYKPQQNVDKMLQEWGLKQMRDWYLPKGATGLEPFYSPIYGSSTDLKDMPHTTVIVGEIDRLLNDAIETVRLLKNAHVSTQLIVLQGQSHNHSVHAGLRDGVFTPDLIAAVMSHKPLEDMKGTDGLGICLKKFPANSSGLNNVQSMSCRL